MDDSRKPEKPLNDFPAPKGWGVGGARRRTEKSRQSARESGRKRKLAHITGRGGKRKARPCETKKVAKALSFAGIEAIRLLTPKAAEALAKGILADYQAGKFESYDKLAADGLIGLEIVRRMALRDVRKRGTTVETREVNPETMELVPVIRENPSAALVVRVCQAMGFTGRDMALSRKSRGESALTDVIARESEARTARMRAMSAELPPPRSQPKQIGPIDVEIVSAKPS